MASFLLLGWGLSVSIAADGGKAKCLEKFERIDEKTLKLTDAQGKVVNTKDRSHPRALELKMDFAKPYGYPGWSKTFPEATLNPARYEGFRFWVRSDVGTAFSVGIGGSYKRKDGKDSYFSGGGFQASSDWKQITIPLSSFKRSSHKFFKDGKQRVSPGGGEPMDEEDYGGTNRISFNTSVDRRGTSVVGHLMFDELELIEKQK